MKLFLSLLVLSFSLCAAKIKDVSSIVGVRDNQVIGYSLVVGLKKTGDGTTSKFTLQSIANMLKAMNIDMIPTDIKSKNVAAVVVTANMGPFTRQGDKIDVTVSSIGDAQSLQGGTLLMTPLKGVDGKIYALAQGPVSIGGKNERGAGADSHPTAGLVYGGGTIEREIDVDIYHQQVATLSLKDSDFKNAVSVQDTINANYKSKIAVAVDARTIKLQKPKEQSMVEFLSKVENLNMDYKPESKIIINERTGTIVAGVDIEVMPVVITQGGITIKIKPSAQPEMPAGSMKVDQDLVIGVNENEIFTKTNTTTVANIVRSLQKLGASPKAIISVLEAMKSEGSITADLEVI